MNLEGISKIIGLILAVCGAIALIFGISSFTTPDPNSTLVVGGAVSLAVGIAIFKIFG